MFSRPVDPGIEIKSHYGEAGRRFKWSIDPDNGLWIPVQGPDGLGQHRGIDFDCEPGTVVRAMADGIVVRARFENALNFGAGAGLYIQQLVIMPGFDSWVLQYSHLQSVHVEPGQRIFRHQAIAESGNSGDVLRPYLHVDLRNLKGQWRRIRFLS